LSSLEKKEKGGANSKGGRDNKGPRKIPVKKKVLRVSSSAGEDEDPQPDRLRNLNLKKGEVISKTIEAVNSMKEDDPE